MSFDFKDLISEDNLLPEGKGILTIITFIDKIIMIKEQMNNETNTAQTS